MRRVRHGVLLLAAVLLPTASSAGTICSVEPAVCAGTSPVNRLQLTGRGLSGTIPTQIGMLSNLMELDLLSNSISGTIPTEIGKLAKFTSLDVFSNSLSGTIPSEIGRFDRLHWLYLAHNSFTGAIPSELGQCGHLHYLSLSSNALTGSIPSTLGRLTHLSSIALSSNSLSGSIPSALAKLKPTAGCYLTAGQCLAAGVNKRVCGTGAGNAFRCPVPMLSASCAKHLDLACPPPSPPQSPPAPPSAAGATSAGTIVAVVAVTALGWYYRQRLQRCLDRMRHPHDTQLLGQGGAPTQGSTTEGPEADGVEATDDAGTDVASPLSIHNLETMSKKKVEKTPMIAKGRELEDAVDSAGAAGSSSGAYASCI